MQSAIRQYIKGGLNGELGVDRNDFGRRATDIFHMKYEQFCWRFFFDIDHYPRALGIYDRLYLQQRGIGAILRSPCSILRNARLTVNDT